VRRWLAAALLVAGVAQAAAPALPSAVLADTANLRPLGEARLRVLVWHVYDATLWAPARAFDAEGPFALDIRYAMDVRGADLAKRSVAEMRGLGYRDAAKLARWEEAMRGVFPDIRAGDRLVGVHVPGREARFYGAKDLIGVVADAEFARAFFAIWLDPGTSEPAMRRALLGLAP